MEEDDDSLSAMREDLLDSLAEAHRGLLSINRRLQGEPDGPTWRWAELPDGRALLVAVDGEIILTAERMPKEEFAADIAASPDRRREKFGILLDRRVFEDDASRRIRRWRNQTSCLLFLDLDGFKAINDRFGHALGDEVLKMFFDAVHLAAGHPSRAYAWGGDEVLVLLGGVSQEDAEAAAKRIEIKLAEKVSHHPVLGSAGATVGVSAGVHIFASSDPLLEEVEKADQKMYAAKRARKEAARTTS